MFRPLPSVTSRRARRFSNHVPRGVAAALTLTAFFAAPPSARADYLADMWNSKEEKVCPLLFGAGCKHTLSADLLVAHQPTQSDDNGKEEYVRYSFELAYSKLLLKDVHGGPVVEFGVQDGSFMTGFHIVPKLRGRYWLGGSPVSVDVALGPYFGRGWLDTGNAGRSRLGVQIDGGLGLLGTLHLVGGLVATGTPGAPYGSQLQAFVGVRVSLLALIAAVGVGLKR